MSGFIGWRRIVFALSSLLCVGCAVAIGQPDSHDLAAESCTKWADTTLMMGSERERLQAQAVDLMTRAADDNKAYLEAAWAMGQLQIFHFGSTSPDFDSFRRYYEAVERPCSQVMDFEARIMNPPQAD